VSVHFEVWKCLNSDKGETRNCNSAAVKGMFHIDPTREEAIAYTEQPGKHSSIYLQPMAMLYTCIKATSKPVSSTGY
jgi:hypothetical protein